jgi:hypothetical protein
VLFEKVVEFAEEGDEAGGFALAVEFANGLGADEATGADVGLNVHGGDVGELQLTQVDE